MSDGGLLSGGLNAQGVNVRGVIVWGGIVRGVNVQVVNVRGVIVRGVNVRPPYLKYKKRKFMLPVKTVIPPNNDLLFFPRCTFMKYLLRWKAMKKFYF